MKWEGETLFADDMIVFRGKSVANALHSMPVTVIAMSHDTKSVVLDEDEAAIGGPVCLIQPLTPHIIAPDRQVTIAFFSPARWSTTGAGSVADAVGFTRLDPDAFPSRQESNLGEIAAGLRQMFQRDSSGLDTRLQAALDLLGRDPGSISVGQAAEAVGLSSSRLRALAQRDLGSPLVSWLTWKKLEQATQSVTGGEGLAQSAITGGFADQAHFSNVMRRLLGTAPSEIEPIRKHS